MDDLALPEYPVAPHPEIDYLCYAEFNLPIGPLSIIHPRGVSIRIALC